MSVSFLLRAKLPRNQLNALRFIPDECESTYNTLLDKVSCVSLNRRIQNLLILLYKSLFLIKFPIYMRNIFTLRTTFWRSLHLNDLWLSLFFNLENIFYFPSCSGGKNSLHHSFTPSLQLETQVGRESSFMKRQWMLFGKFEFNSWGRQMQTLLELH